MPMKSFITVDVNQILVDSASILLPDDFQKHNETTRGSFSIVDSCSSYIHLPAVAYNALVSKIKSSNAASYFNNSDSNNVSHGKKAILLNNVLNSFSLGLDTHGHLRQSTIQNYQH